MVEKGITRRILRRDNIRGIMRRVDGLQATIGPDLNSTRRRRALKTRAREMYLLPKFTQRSVKAFLLYSLRLLRLPYSQRSSLALLTRAPHTHFNSVPNSLTNDNDESFSPPRTFFRRVR